MRVLGNCLATRLVLNAELGIVAVERAEAVVETHKAVSSKESMNIDFLRREV